MYSALFATSDNYEQLNREFVIETSAGNRPSFAVPKGTVSASFALRLPREDNERDGLGNIHPSVLPLPPKNLIRLLLCSFCAAAR